jgi:hypothetical protein
MQRSVFEDAVTETSTSPKYKLGMLREEDSGKVYQYVKNIDVTAADGWALTAGDATDPTIVSGDRSGGSAINSIPVGVAVGSFPINSYGWVLVRGYKANVLSDGSVAAGEGLIAHASTDGGVDSAAVGSTVTITNHQIFGLALAADTTSRVKALIRCL